MKNSADLGGCYPPRPKAEVDNTLLYLQNSSYPTQPHSIIANYSNEGAIYAKGLCVSQFSKCVYGWWNEIFGLLFVFDSVVSVTEMRHFVVLKYCYGSLIYFTSYS